MLGEGQVAQERQGGDVGAEQRQQQEEEESDMSIAFSSGPACRKAYWDWRHGVLGLHKIPQHCLV